MSIAKDRKAETTKRKRRFNFVDFLILVFVALFIFLGVYVIKPVSLIRRWMDNETYTVEYTVEIENVDEQFIENVRIGQICLDSVSKSELGSVVDVDGNTEYVVLEYDETNEQGVLTPYPDRYNLLITVHAECTYEEGRGYFANGTRIAVGEAMALRFSDFVGEGYCIGFTVID